MRQFMKLVEVNSPLDEALTQIAEHILHNSGADLRGPSQVIRQHGYQEPCPPGRYFRALLHDITAQEREAYATVGELQQVIIQEVRFELARGPQSFTTSFEKAAEFINGVYWLRDTFPDHRPESPLDGLHNVAVVYEVEAPAQAILLSMRGLSRFLEAVPHSTGRDLLHKALHDMWDGYGGDDEVVIDTSNGVKITSIQPYNSSIHGPTE